MNGFVGKWIIQSRKDLAMKTIVATLFALSVNKLRFMRHVRRIWFIPGPVRRLVVISGILASVVIPSVAMANHPSRIILYEGNNCTQDIVGIIEYTGSYNLKNYRGWNDEARSIYFQNTASLNVLVFDSPSGDRGDDWSEIYYSSPGDYCIWSFEEDEIAQTNSAGGGWSLTYHSNNGLDGKVSRIEVYLR